MLERDVSVGKTPQSATPTASRTSTGRPLASSPLQGGRECSPHVSKIVAFCCNWCSYAGADGAGTARKQYPETIKIIKVPCSCRVNPLFILRAFARGADGVILCGCHPGDCHYTTGNYYTRRRMTLLMSMLKYMGVAEERFRVEWVSAAEGARFAQVMNDFAAHIDALGENVKLRDLRCKK